MLPVGCHGLFDVRTWFCLHVLEKIIGYNLLIILRILIHEETLSNMPYQFYNLSRHGGKSPIHGKMINVGFIFPQLVKKKTNLCVIALPLGLLSI